MLHTLRYIAYTYHLYDAYIYTPEQTHSESKAPAQLAALMVMLAKTNRVPPLAKTKSCVDLTETYGSWSIP